MTALLHRFAFAVLCLCCANAVLAQPLDHGHHEYGCHFLKNKLHLSPLEDAERAATCGSNARSDSIDILNYAVSLDLTQFSQQTIAAYCEIRFTPKIDGLEALPLDLLNLTVDSVMWQGNALSFDYDNLLLNVHLPASLNIGDTTEIVVYYQGHPTADPSGFGGFVFENGYAYNLGIGLSSNPYNFGRSWHPCFDNFVERATYDLNIVTNTAHKGYAIGEFLGETDLGGGEILRQYRMSLPLPTYLVGVAASTYREVNQTHQGIYGERPILLVGKGPDTTAMKNAFSDLPAIVDNLESWFGPYIWGNVGYVMTTAGAMEHASLIAYPDFMIASGASVAMNRLAAHELGHHWWGNITTLSCPENMWIKEGNAEYSAHLTLEQIYGRDFFLKYVTDNFQDVISSAHLDDGAYLPLSGLPYENTYGTHTYYKGASMMHNLRTYLGDTLFQQGMQSILETYQFQSVDAELFRDQLTSNTGVDMTSFFDDWIYSPGYSSFEIDSVKLAPSDVPEYWEASVFVQQKLHHAPHLHTNVPLEITFFDENWQEFRATFLASGEFTEAKVEVPFQPVWQVLNDQQRLNIARFQDRKVLKNTGNYSLEHCNVVSPSVQEIADSALVSFIHYWVAPDPAEGVQLSSTHYWRFGGIIPPGFRGRATLPYEGASDTDFDYDLTGNTEDSIFLAWRPKPGVPWAKYPYYTKLGFSATDGNGFIRVDTLLPGDYAFGNGDLPLATGLHDSFRQQPTTVLTVAPNPVADQALVQAKLPFNGTVHLGVYSPLGQLVKTETATVNGGLFSQNLAVGGLPPGMYALRLTDEDGVLIGVGKLLKG